nr:LacI family DNA-binding transcriptional regulator [Caballeronia sp. GAOx1]
MHRRSFADRAGCRRRAKVSVGFVSRVLNGRDNVAPKIHKAVTH